MPWLKKTKNGEKANNSLHNTRNANNTKGIFKLTIQRQTDNTIKKTKNDEDANNSI